jgi:hypothetical protein
MNIPFFSELEGSRNILIAGAGGGFDVFCGLPLFFSIDYVGLRMPRRPSIVNSSIVSAVNGWFGNRHPTKRTEGSDLFINPLMALYWAFRLDHVARRNLYLERIADTTSYGELSLAIDTFRSSLPKLRNWKDIPC